MLDTVSLDKVNHWCYADLWGKFCFEACLLQRQDYGDVGLEIYFVLDTKVHFVLVTEVEWVDGSLRSVFSGMNLPPIGWLSRHEAFTDWLTSINIFTEAAVIDWLRTFKISFGDFLEPWIWNSQWLIRQK